MGVLENVESEKGSPDLDQSIQTQGLKCTDLKSEEKEEDHQISESDSKLEGLKLVNGNSHEKGMDHNGEVGNGGFQYSRENEDSGNEGLKRDMKELEDFLSKLNPMAQEFVPISAFNGLNYGAAVFGYPNGFVMSPNSGDINGHMGRQKKNGYTQGKRRMNNRTSMAQREDAIRRTVYVSDIDNQITEEQLAGLFLNCGQVVDCRICGDPNSILRFAFLEFTDEESARAALTLSGTMLGFYPVKVMPSKTAIAPVNPTFLPRSEDEREMCIRTIYCTNIDKNITQNEVKLFFEAYCGEVHQLRLLGDHRHSTRIAFVEFVTVLYLKLLFHLNCLLMHLLASPSSIRTCPHTPVFILSLRWLKVLLLHSTAAAVF